MPTKKKDQAPAAIETLDVTETRGVEPVAPPPVDVSAVREEAAAAERKRATDISSAVRAAKLPVTFAETLIRDGVDIDKARARIIDEWARDDGDQEIRGVRTSVDHDIVDNMRAGP